MLNIDLPSDGLSYVYVLTDRRTNEIVYVGKGTGPRALKHVDEVLKLRRDRALARSAKLPAPVFSAKQKRLARIRLEDLEVVIVARGLGSKEALVVEAALINALLLGATPALTNDVLGHHHRSGALFSPSARPEVRLTNSDRLVIVKIDRVLAELWTSDARYVSLSGALNPRSSHAYHKTRQWWVVGQPLVDSWSGGSEKAPSHLLGLFHGVVAGVYRFDHRRWKEMDSFALGNGARKWQLPVRTQATPQIDAAVGRFYGHRLATSDGSPFRIKNEDGRAYWLKA
jgi:hypothetical protein